MHKEESVKIGGGAGHSRAHRPVVLAGKAPYNCTALGVSALSIARTRSPLKMAPLIIPDANSCCGSGCAQLARTAACALLPQLYPPRPVQPGVPAQCSCVAQVSCLAEYVH